MVTSGPNVRHLRQILDSSTEVGNCLQLIATTIHAITIIGQSVAIDESIVKLTTILAQAEASSSQLSLLQNSTSVSTGADNPAASMELRGLTQQMIKVIAVDLSVVDQELQLCGNRITMIRCLLTARPDSI